MLYAKRSRKVLPARRNGVGPSAEPSVENDGPWITMTAMCVLSGVPRSVAARLAWSSLYHAMKSGGVPEVGGTSVRMAVVRDRSTQTPRPNICMHGDDARAAADAFRELVGRFDAKLNSGSELYSRDRHRDWIMRDAAFQLIEGSIGPDVFDGMWRHLVKEARERRPSAVADRELRTRILVRSDGVSRLHIHRDDVAGLDWRRYADDARYLSLRQIRDHYHEQDEWLGYVAEKILLKVRASLENTGRYELQGVALGQARVPTARGFQMRLPASALPWIQRVVLRTFHESFQHDLDRLLPDEDELGSGVDRHEAGLSTMSMMPT